MTREFESYAKRGSPPPILLAGDLVEILGLPSERSAREFVARHGVPCCRLGGRIYVRLAALLAFFEAHETRARTDEEVRAEAADELHRLAPTLRQKQARRRFSRRRPENP
jgi:hypothetical protein